MAAGCLDPPQLDGRRRAYPRAAVLSVDVGSAGALGNAVLRSIAGGTSLSFARTGPSSAATTNSKCNGNDLWSMKASGGEKGRSLSTQVAIAMPPLSPKAGSGGSMAGKGLIVVGGSVRHRDGQHHHSKVGNSNPAAAGGESDRGADPLVVHVEAFVPGEEAAMREGRKRTRAAALFTFFGLDRAGHVVWRHEAQTAQVHVGQQAM